jgi:hypothetical protein
MSTNSTSTSAFIYYGIKLRYIDLGKRYSFPFTSAAAAIAIATAVARA